MKTKHTHGKRSIGNLINSLCYSWHFIFGVAILKKNFLSHLAAFASFFAKLTFSTNTWIKIGTTISTLESWACYVRLLQVEK